MASVTISGLGTGEPAGTRTLGPLTIPGSSIIGETDAISVQSGDNTIAVPSGAIGAVIIPPTAGAGGSSVTLKLRTGLNSTDAGVPISSTVATVYSFPAIPPTSLIVNASSTMSGLLDIWFW